jgi:myo-inositol 2-dehydrogenase / D-chiro-inositol 1-dehydrogenase
VTPVPRVGVVGSGFMGGVHADAWRDAGAPITSVLTRPGSSSGADLARRHGVPAVSDWDEFMAGVDVVDLCTPTHLHAEQVLRAAEAGTAVVVEKPLARTAAQAAELVATCERLGVPLLVGHVLRFFPEYARAKSVVDRGDIGTPGVLRLSRNRSLPEKPGDNWFLDEEKSGGLVLDLMIHDLDYAQWVAGPVTSVYARSVRSARPASDVDHAVALLTHAGGAITHLEASWAHPPGVFHTYLEIAGTTGLLQSDSDRTTPVRPALREPAVDGVVPLPGSPLARSPFELQMRSFLDVLAGRAEPVVTPQEALAAVRAAEAAVESLRTGTPVQLPLEENLR